MNRYKVVMTFEAKTAAEAAAIAVDPERMPRGSKMQIVNVDRRRTIRQATFLGLLVAFWTVVLMEAVHYWRYLK